MADDAELLQGYVQGSEDAFSELVRRHANLVYSVALRQTAGDTHLAGDVMSAVFTDLARKARNLASHPVLGGWLYRAARFAAIDAVRAEQRRHERERKALMMENPGTCAGVQEGGVDWDQVRPLLDHAVSKLSDSDRDAVVLRYFEGKSFAEMGDRLCVSENAARKRVVHALERLQRVLRRHGVRSTETMLAAVLAQQVATAAPSALVASVAVSAAASIGSLGIMASTLMKTAQVWKIGMGIALLAAATATVIRQQHSIGTLRLENAGLQQIRQENRQLHAENAHLKEAIQMATRGGARTVGPEDHHEFNTVDAAKGMASPEMQRMLALQAKFALDSRYAGLFKQLHLSADKLDGLKQLMVSRSMLANDVFTSAMTQGLDPVKDRQELADMTKEGQAKIDDEIQALLGSSYSTYQDYQQTLPQRLVVGQLQQTLSYSADPLTDAQADQLTQILAQNPALPPAGAPPKGEGPHVMFMAGSITTDATDMPPDGALFSGPPISDAAVVASSSILSPTQLAALQSLQQQEAALHALMMPSRSSAGGTPAIQQIEIHSGPG